MDNTDHILLITANIGIWLTLLAVLFLRGPWRGA